MKIFLATISSILLVLAFDLHWAFSFVGLIPLLIIHRQNLPTWQHIAYGAFAGVLFAAINMRWHWGITIDGVETAWPLLLFVWLLSSLNGAWVGLWSYVASKSQNPLILAVAWGIAEVARAWWIGLLWYAPGVMLGTNWTVSFLGYSLAESRYIALATLPLGVITMGVIIALVNGLIFNLPKTKLGIPVKDCALHLVLVLVIIGTFTYHFHHQEKPEQPLTVSMEIDKEADVILLHENSNLKEIPDYENSLIIDSTSSEFNFIYTLDGSELKGNKFLLMPHGEYMPMITKPILSIFGASEKIPDLKPNPHSGLQYVNGVSILATACSDVLSWTLFNNSRDSLGKKIKPDVITNSASYRWFEDSDLLQKHSQQWARVRAVETGAWYYQNTNYGDNFKVNPKGQLQKL